MNESDSYFAKCYKIKYEARYFLNSTPDFATIDKELATVKLRSEFASTVRKDKGSGNKPTQQRKQKQPVKVNK